MEEYSLHKDDPKFPLKSMVIIFLKFGMPIRVFPILVLNLARLDDLDEFI